MTIYHEPLPMFEVWEQGWEYEYFIGYCYGWDDSDYYWRCGYIVQRIE
jgi:hypothetical protein